MSDSDVKSTPLAAKHIELGARMVPFSGWNMPVQYTGILDEHKAVREPAASLTSPTWANSRYPARTRRHG